jgi:hypothetical protein
VPAGGAVVPGARVALERVGKVAAVEEVVAEVVVAAPNAFLYAKIRVKNLAEKTQSEKFGFETYVENLAGKTQHETFGGNNTGIWRENFGGKTTK